MGIQLQNSFFISLNLVPSAKQMNPPEMQGEEGNEELFNEYRVSVLQDERNSGDRLHSNVDG